MVTSRLFSTRDRMPSLTIALGAPPDLRPPGPIDLEIRAADRFGCNELKERVRLLDDCPALSDNFIRMPIVNSDPIERVDQIEGQKGST